MGRPSRVTRRAPKDVHGRIAERSGANLSQPERSAVLPMGLKAPDGSNPTERRNTCSTSKPKN